MQEDGMDGRVSGYLDRLTESQREAATADGPVLVLAGAGTGKTTALTSAVAWRIDGLGIPARRILAVTFTNKAAAEMRSRISAMLVGGDVPGWIGTFHQLAGWQLRSDPAIGGLSAGFDVLDADDSRMMLKRIMDRMGIATREDADDRRHRILDGVVRNIAKLKDVVVPPSGALEAAASINARPGRDQDEARMLQLAATVYPEYQRSLREANSADFGDLLLWPTLAMREDQDFREHWAGRFDAVLADEYQDVNYVQYLWLKLLSARHRRIFAVGDDDQAIFSWRGSDVTYIRKFQQDYPDASLVRLEDNFRSTSHIVAAANAIISRNTDRIGKTLVAHRGEGLKLERLRFGNAKEEADEVVAEIIRRRAEGGDWGRYAVLYRNNHVSRAFEDALLRARVPYTIVGDVGFWKRAEVKDMMAYLKLALNGASRQSDEAFRRVANTPRRGLGDAKMQAIEDAAVDGRSMLDASSYAQLPPAARDAAASLRQAVMAASSPGMTLPHRLSVLLDSSGYQRMLKDPRTEDGEGRLANVQELIEVSSGFSTAEELFDHVALNDRDVLSDPQGLVRLMTLHKAKGLEFDDVFLPAWEEGMFPSSRSDQAEERRLAYVALTRGRNSVTVSSCDFRHQLAQPSLFLKEIPSQTIVDGWRRGGFRVAPPLQRRSATPFGRPAFRPSQPLQPPSPGRKPS